MATGRVLKKVLAMSALAGALLIAAPAEAHDRYDGGRRDYHHDDYRGHGWGGRDDHWRDRGYYNRWNGRGWGNYPRYYGPAPRYYYYHRHYRGCGHAGYDHGFYDGALLGFLVDYARDE